MQITKSKLREVIRQMINEVSEGGPGSGRTSTNADRNRYGKYRKSPKGKKKGKGTKLSQWADDKKSKEKKYKSEKEFAKSLGLEGGPGSGRNPEGGSDRKPDITMQMADRERGKMITKKDKGTLNKLAKLMKHANEGKLTEQHKLLKQSKLSSAEYQKAKKISGFKTKNYKWNSKQDLYIKESLKKEGKLSDQITIPETDKRAVLQILKKLRLNPGRDYDLGVGKGATFVLDLNKKYQSKVFDLFKKHRVRTHKMWDM
jgi:hypothetical protein